MTYTPAYLAAAVNLAASTGYALAAREAVTERLTGPERIASAAKAEAHRRALSTLGVTSAHLIPATSDEPDDVEPQEPAAEEPHADDVEPTGDDGAEEPAAEEPAA